MKRPFRISADIVKSFIDPYDFYLKEQGISHFGYRSQQWAVAGLCPFHADNSPGSFKVNIETGAFKCWSCGTCGGDIISFVQMLHDLSFPEALEELAREWGITA